MTGTRTSRRLAGAGALSMGGLRMRMRFAKGLSVAVAMGLLLSTGVALAAGSKPAVNVNWKSGKPSPFAGTRFDGAVVDGKFYFLGFRAADDSTDGSVWYY